MQNKFSDKNKCKKYKSSEEVKKEIEYYTAHSEEKAKKMLDCVEKPVMILNMDERLSVYYGNPEFYHLFETDETSFSMLYHNKFSYTFTIQHQLEQLKKMREFLGCEGRYGSDVEVITSSGEVKTIYFDMVRKEIGKVGEKLFGFIVAKEEEAFEAPCFS